MSKKKGAKQPKSGKKAIDIQAKSAPEQPMYWPFGYTTRFVNNTRTAEKALALTAVWACVRFLAETISTLPLKVYEKDEQGGRKEAKEHQLFKVLCEEPNKKQTPMKLLQFVVACLSLSGNCWYEKKMMGSKLVALYPIEPKYQRKIELRADGVYAFHFTDEYRQEHVLTEDFIWMVSGFGGLESMLGVDPIAKGQKMIDAAESSIDASLEFFEKGLQASGFVSTDQKMTLAQHEALQKRFERFSGSSNAGKIISLEAGMKFQGLSIDPQAAQLLESRGYDAEEICRFFRVPPALVGYSSGKQSSWGSSIDAMTQQVLKFTLLPILVNIEQSINRYLIKPSERGKIFAEFSVEGFLRADVAARSNFYSTMLNQGVMSRNEVRRFENLAPMPDGGDIFTVQSALIPVQDVGKNYEK